MTRDPWYSTRRVLPGVWSIAEAQHCYMWLIEGSDRAILFDTGIGFRPLRPTIESLTSLPITVVNSHCHIDHIGADHEFDRVEIHELGAKAISQPVPPDDVRRYVVYGLRQLAALETFRALDHDYYWLLTDPSVPRPASPPEWERWVVPSVIASATFHGGETIDLGDRQLSIIHTPGHSHDSVCLLDERDGLLFAADTAGYGPLYAHWSDSDLDTYARSATALREIDSSVKMIMASHYPHVITDTELLKDLERALQQIQDGTAPRVLAADIFGNPVWESRFRYFFITRPVELEHAAKSPD